jgi:uncharacterized membrane protein (UPF0127 family)
VGTGQTVRALHADSGAVVAERIEVAKSLRARARGLLGRTGLEPSSGILLDPCSSIHMFFMQFPIDAVFLDRAGRVVKVLPHLRPWRMSPIVFGARRVLELPAGAAQQAGLRKGEVIRFSPSA